MQCHPELACPELACPELVSGFQDLLILLELKIPK